MKLYGHSATGGNSLIAECPGKDCERLEGVGDGTWTLEEQWEDASPGCPRRCRSLRTSYSETVGDFEDGELDTWFAEIESLIDEHRAFRVDPETLSYFQRECFVFWLKIESDFERQIGVTLRILADSFFKK